MLIQVGIVPHDDLPLEQVEWIENQSNRDFVRILDGDDGRVSSVECAAIGEDEILDGHFDEDEIVVENSHPRFGEFRSKAFRVSKGYWLFESIMQM